MTKRIRPQLRFERLEDRSLLSGISAVAEYPTPTPSAVPWTIATGPDGNLWFVERSANKIGMINSTTHAVSEFAVPTSNAGLWEVAAGPDGNVWFTERTASKVGMINPTTHVIKEYKTPSIAPIGITAGPDGNVWFAGGRGIGTINPTTKAVTVYPSPSTWPNYPAWITPGPDGNLWFDELGGNSLGKINPVTHAETTYNVPSGPFGYAEIEQLTEGPDGNIWFTDVNNNGVGAINPTSGVISEFYTPGTVYEGINGITAGPDGNIWFAEGTAGTIGSINPATHVITEFPLPAPAQVGIGITTGPDDSLWFTDGTFANGTNSAIGVATLATSQLVVTQGPPSTVTAGTPFGLTVEAEDSSGNLLSSFNGTVTLAMASNPGGATLGGTLTATATDGVATFSGLTLTTAASGYTLAISGVGLGSGNTGAITVTPAAASQVVVTQEPPSSVVAGVGFGLQGTIEDPYGNVVTSATNTVSVALTTGPAGASLGGTLTATASHGLAGFYLTLTSAASGYTLQVSSTGLGAPVTTALTVTPAAAVGLLIAQEPTSVVVNAGFLLVVEVVDAYGNVVTSDNNTVTIAPGNNPSGAKLGGTKSVSLVNGVATFSGLTLNKVGTGYTILISSKGLTGATAGPINVTAS